MVWTPIGGGHTGGSVRSAAYVPASMELVELVWSLLSVYVFLAVLCKVGYLKSLPTKQDLFPGFTWIRTSAPACHLFSRLGWFLPYLKSSWCACAISLCITTGWLSPFLLATSHNKLMILFSLPSDTWFGQFFALGLVSCPGSWGQMPVFLLWRVLRKQKKNEKQKVWYRFYTAQNYNRVTCNLNALWAWSYSLFSPLQLFRLPLNLVITMVEVSRHLTHSPWPRRSDPSELHLALFPAVNQWQAFQTCYHQKPPFILSRTSLIVLFQFPENIESICCKLFRHFTSPSQNFFLKPNSLF